MIGKLFGALTSLLVAFCMATVIAGAVLTVYYGRAWQVNREKLVHMLAIAQGVDLAAVREQARGDHEDPASEEPSYSQVLEARAVKTRNLELREQALRSGVQQVQTEQHKLDDEMKRLVELRSGFEGDLASLKKGAVAEGRDNALRTLEALKPKQAKALLQQMLDQKEMDEVVLLLASMTEKKRAKIAAEFKTPAEVEQFGDVLRRIRQGTPGANVAENTQKKMEP